MSPLDLFSLMAGLSGVLSLIYIIIYILWQTRRNKLIAKQIISPTNSKHKKDIDNVPPFQKTYRKPSSIRSHYIKGTKIR